MMETKLRMIKMNDTFRRRRGLKFKRLIWEKFLHQWMTFIRAADIVHFDMGKITIIKNILKDIF